MIDVISCSIRLGKYLRKTSKYQSIYEFYFSNEDNEIFNEYKQLLNQHFKKYGFYAFDYVDNLLKENLKDTLGMGYTIAKSIMDFLKIQPNYKEIISISKELGEIIKEYVHSLMTNILTFPTINISQYSLKLQQISNELSTSILRTGGFKWVTNQEDMKLLKKHSDFLNEYEELTKCRRNNYPYCKEIMNIIKSLPNSKRKIAQITENIALIQYLIENGIIQGFFFEIFEISEGAISKIKQKNKNESIHPVVLKVNLTFPTNQLMIFKYTIEGNEKYLLARKIVTKFGSKGIRMYIIGYCYPTNEYSLFERKIS